MGQVEPRSFFRSRFGRALIFVAIVWSVAASFIAIEIAALGGMGWFMSRPEIAGSLVLSNATRDSKTCAAEAGERAVPAEVRVAAWLMGLSIGRHGNARQHADVDPKVLAQVMEEVETLANALSVPVPQPFVPRQLADANTEFITFVESDANETPRSLARKHSSEACHLFKLGALWGYASAVRPFVPGELAIFAAEIRHHAQGVLPAELWQPMTEGTKASASKKEIFRAVATVDDSVRKYLGGQR